MQTRIDARKMTWEDLAKYIYDVDGSLPDVLVLGTTRDDWKIWVDCANANYRVMFRDENYQEHEKIDFTALVNYWNSNYEGDIPFASVFLGSIQVNCFFNSDDTIRNDIDPREINSLDDHLQLVEYLTKISTLLSKNVLLVGEGTRVDSNNEVDTEPLLIIDQTEVSAYAYWLDERQ